MAYTLQQLQALDTAIAQGTRTVKYGDKWVEYRSLDEMLRIRNLMAEELGLNKQAASNRRFASFSKGINNCKK